MPRASHQQTLHRQWVILRKLTTRRPGITARELTDYLASEDLPVSKRTVERDLNALSCLFPLVTSGESPPIGWRWREGAVQELPGLELVDALSLSLVGDLLDQTLPASLHPSISARVEEARNKLDALPNHSLAAWSQLVRYLPPGQALLQPKVSPDILHTVEEALICQRQLAVCYQTPSKPEPWTTQMHPIALLAHGSTPYLLASLGEGRDLRQYPLHRFCSAELSETPSWRPADFDLDDFLAQGKANFGKSKTIRLEAQVEQSLATLLRETPLSKDQTLRQNGEKFTLKATVHDSWQLLFYLLSQGHKVTVIKPKSLRNAIIADLQSSLKNYSPI